MFCILTRVWVTQGSTFMVHLRSVHFMANFTLGKNKRTLVSDMQASVLGGRGVVSAVPFEMDPRRK